MESFFKKHRILISQTNSEIVRDIMKSVNWDKQLSGTKQKHGAELSVKYAKSRAAASVVCRQQVGDQNAKA